MAEAGHAHHALGDQDQESDLGINRTIAIQNIPGSICTYEIVNQLGPAVITNVAPLALSTSAEPRSLLVSFLDQQDALECIRRTRLRLETLASLQPHQPPIKIDEQPLATYPMAQGIRELIEAGVLSRIIVLEGVANTVTHNKLADSLSDYGTKWHGILAIETVHSGQTHSDLHVHLGSIDNAIRCYTKAINLEVLARSTISFLPDPGLATITSSGETRAEALRSLMAEPNKRDAITGRYNPSRRRDSFHPDYDANDDGQAIPRGPRGWSGNNPRVWRHTSAEAIEWSEEATEYDDNEEIETPEESPRMGILIEGLEETEAGECVLYEGKTYEGETHEGAMAEAVENIMDAE